MAVFAVYITLELAMLRATLLALLAFLFLFGAAIAIYCGVHFSLTLSSKNWLETQGRIVENKQEWSSSRWHSGFCSRIRYTFSLDGHEMVGSSLRPGLLQDGCSTSAKIGEIPVSSLAIGQEIRVFVIKEEKVAVLERSGLFVSPLVMLSIGLLTLLASGRGILVVLRESQTSSNPAPQPTAASGRS